VPRCRVLLVDERRLLAAGLALVIEAQPEVAEARALQDLSSLPVALSSGWDVVVTSENYAAHVLRLVPASTRVLVVVQHPDVAALARLLRLGAAGACTPGDMPEDVALAVEQVARGEMRLPGELVHQVLAELQRLRQRAQDADDVLTQLTERERDVLSGLGQGRGRSEIALDLGLSPHTVRTHVQHLLRKLDLHSQMEAAAYARELVAALPPTSRGYGDPTVVIDLDERKDLRGTPARS
jgi:DNA-binding NarL/FixJ family response regulator